MSGSSNVAIIKFSELGNRLDARFHILRDRLKGETAKIVSEMTMEDIKKEGSEAFSKMPPAFRKCLDPLLRTGGTHSPTLEQYQRAMEEYPALSLAVMRNKYDEVREHYENLVRQARENSEFFKKD